MAYNPHVPIDTQGFFHRYITREKLIEILTNEVPAKSVIAVSLLGELTVFKGLTPTGNYDDYAGFIGIGIEDFEPAVRLEDDDTETEAQGS